MTKAADKFVEVGNSLNRELFISPLRIDLLDREVSLVC